MNIASLLRPIALAHGKRPAVSLGTELYLDYAGLYRRSTTLAGGLLGRVGLCPGDRVALAMTNVPQYLEILCASWHAGLCTVPINAKLHPREFAYILENSGARLCFATPDLFPEIEKLVGEIASLKRVISVDDEAYHALTAANEVEIASVSEDDPAWLFYTSGTTGKPKGATLSHRNLLAMSLRYYADIDQLGPDDTHLLVAPLSHSSGLYAIPHLARGSHQVVPASGGFSPDEVFDLLDHYRNAAFFNAPTMLKRLADHPRAAAVKRGAIRTIYYGGAPMYLEDLKHAYGVFGPCLAQTYGQGESPMTGTILSKADHARGMESGNLALLETAGYARTGVLVRIFDDRGQEVPTGETGEVVFKSDVSMRGYWDNPQATAATIKDGWLHTGDIGSMDASGLLTLKDRSKDVIISGGSNIYPREVEEVLLRDERLLEVSVVGRPHTDWGEEVVAFVVPRPGQSVAFEELDALCLEHIARFKRPKAYRLIEALPKNNYGKILKTELRQKLADEQAGSGDGRGRS
ncbi:Long-chain fatty acid--CoA ligase [Hyphomicrobiales bacterium]|nr:Long-chain fatty acid--CoA ligase [Hyphomicrobiales bacterium]CAH1691885.1 Long-chain fatty acid--CoA ligase [Hyphomicrobiales bacterium]